MKIFLFYKLVRNFIIYESPYANYMGIYIILVQLFTKLVKWLAEFCCNLHVNQREYKIHCGGEFGETLFE